MIPIIKTWNPLGKYNELTIVKYINNSYILTNPDKNTSKPDPIISKIGLLPLHRIDNTNKVCSRSNNEFIDELKKLYGGTVSEDELFNWIKL